MTYQSDAIMIFITGYGGWAGIPGSIFGPSPLMGSYRWFCQEYPTVRCLPLEWKNGMKLEEFVQGCVVGTVKHSYGGQRGLHAADAVKVTVPTWEMIGIDDVRYTTQDDVDPTDEITDNPWAQHIDRKPLPVPNIVTKYQSFLRVGGQNPVASWPCSSEIETVEKSTYSNVWIDNVDHNTIVTCATVRIAVKKMCMDLFGLPLSQGVRS